ncbi:hypothetical protein BDZ90DRAFT_230001 [Jaminaea rosea]|uniref:Uncharacterized protein n=1 Tax=Jaminaea rosea TaxID=1569628 RepID=A0A316V6D8_9BASI|nr:hypothetical protein BDZ90DRAFT_230001 [Jaminaea rosea]PWN31005.1 hypothetical protein BDZ90DRAFT_230001 [Jaminaea rosea]
MAGSASSSSSTTGTTTMSTGGAGQPSSSSSHAQFSLPPPVDFDAIRRKQRAITQAAGSAASSNGSQMNSPAYQQGGGSSGGAAGNHFSMSGSNGVNGSSSSSGGGGPKLPTTSSSAGAFGSGNDPDAFQAALDQLMAGNDHAMGTPTHPPGGHANMFAPSQQQPAPHHHHHHPHGPARQNSQPTTPQGAPMMMANQFHQQHQQPQHHSHPHLAHSHHHHHHHPHAPQQPQQPSSQPGSSASPFPPSASPMPAEEHARLLGNASMSFNTFAMDLGRSQQAAAGMQYIDPSVTAWVGGVRSAAQTLCTELAGISQALRAGSMSLWRGQGGRPGPAGTGATNQFWPNDFASMFAQMQGQQSGDSSAQASPANPRGMGGAQGQRGMPNAANMEPTMLLNFLDQNQGLPPGLPPGPAEQMLDFLTQPSTGIAHDVNGSSASSSNAAIANKKRPADSSASPAGPAAGPSASKIPKAAGKHKSRPPIEGVRRESVRYRNRKLLVDMREQLYKWLDTTEFCRIARSYPQGSNGWATVPIDAERPELGTKRVFKPNFEIGSDLYICNKELLEALIELGQQKVRDGPEAYGMKEGVEAKDVVVDVAKDLMDSARHGYRANLKKQQEDEADAKAKSTRYKQQERHRTKVRNREVGAKRLRHPIPDALLTMGLHSDDAASDQEDMHKMDKDEWRRTRLRKLQSKRGWEALSPRWRNPHLTKAYHIADTLSKSKQMPRWRRDGGVDLDPPSRLWGKTLPKVVFDPTWLAENEQRIKEDPFHITVEDRPVAGWRNEEHGLSDDTEDELERFEREVARLNRAARKKTAGTAGPSSNAYSMMGMPGASGTAGTGRQHSSSASSPSTGNSEGRDRGRSNSGRSGEGEDADGDADDEGHSGDVGMSMDVDTKDSRSALLPGVGTAIGGAGGAGGSLLHQTAGLV